MVKRSSLSILIGVGLSASPVLGAAYTERPVLRPPMIESPLARKRLHTTKAGKKTSAKAKTKAKTKANKVARRLKATNIYTSVDHGPYFDLPITYNHKVSRWIRFFQKEGRKDFKRWLERSHRYIPKIAPNLEKEGLPKDLVYLAMIESGFSSQAVSSASAVGYWQFIRPTAKRYGLEVSWWLDERRDIIKSTMAAADYLNDLYGMFNSWYLAAAAYNTGEGRIKRLVKKYKTHNYWVLSKKPEFPKETENYIPKLIAAMLISKAPKMYGFDNITPLQPYDYEYFNVPGGTDLENLAYYIGADKTLVRQMNPELVKGFVPQFVTSHKIRIPKGSMVKVSEFVRATL